MKRIVWIPAIVAASLPMAAAPAAAQGEGGAPEMTSIQAGVYTREQAGIGRRTFMEACSGCHASSQFGAAFLRGWAGRTVHDLVEQIRTTMPYDSPGRLTLEEYADLVAYIFSINGVPSGETAMGADAGLKRIRIEIAADPAR